MLKNIKFCKTHQVSIQIMSTTSTTSSTRHVERGLSQKDTEILFNEHSKEPEADITRPLNLSEIMKDDQTTPGSPEASKSVIEIIASNCKSTNTKTSSTL